jgi:hypothetical protein
MYRLPRCLFHVALLLALSGSGASAASFVYEGRLDDLGRPANGRYDLRLVPYGDVAKGTTLAAAMTFPSVEVRDGRFRLDVDLPLVASDAVWLEVAVRASGDAAFSTIPGRSKAVAAPLVGACWSTVGDSGSNPATNFIGSTDAQPFVVRTANARSLRIEPSTITSGVPALPITANIIAGSQANTVTAGVRGATIAGGGATSGETDPDHFGSSPNRVTDNYGAVGGGLGNRAGDGTAPTTQAAFATVAGGFLNTASGELSTIGGGDGNEATASASTVAGGGINVASGPVSTVGGGNANTASGFASAVAGGQGNCAGGTFSWAGGRQVKIRPGSDSGTSGSACAGVASVGTGGDAGTFAWADSFLQDFTSTGPNQFLVRASGAVVMQKLIGSEASARLPRGYLNVVSGDSGLPQAAAPDSTAVAVFENSNGANIFLIAGGTENKGLRFGDSVSAVQGGIAYTPNQNMQFRTNGNVVRMTLGADGTLALNTLGSAGATTLCRNASNQLSTCSSSARYKDDISDLELGLEAALRLHAVGYRWKDSGTADIGFVAEEIAAIDERLVTRNDRGEIEGVKYDRLTAVLANALRELRAETDAQLADHAQRAAADRDALHAENVALRARIDSIEQTQQAQLAALRDTLAHDNAELRAELARLRDLIAPALAGGH